MLENYDFSLKEVLKSEGGYTNDPLDPGGPTNFGITIHDYRAYINHAGTAKDVKNMTVQQAAAIYKAKYWDAVEGDHLPSGLDYCVFDYGVNSGVNRANRVYAQYKTIDAICDERLRFLRQLRTWNHFGKGWSDRVAKVRKLSKELECHTSQMTSLPQQPRQYLTTSSPPSHFKVLLTLLQKIFYMVWYRGNVQTH